MSHPDDTHGRVDYDSTFVSPEAYVVECPSCDHRHERELLTPYRCPKCDKAIKVNL